MVGFTVVIVFVFLFGFKSVSLAGIQELISSVEGMKVCKGGLGFFGQVTVGFGELAWTDVARVVAVVTKDELFFPARSERINEEERCVGCLLMSDWVVVSVSKARG